MGRTPKIVKINFALLAIFMATAWTIWIPGLSAEFGWAAVIATFILTPILITHSVRAIRELWRTKKSRGDYFDLAVPLLSLIAGVVMPSILLGIILLMNEAKQVFGSFIE